MCYRPHGLSPKRNNAAAVVMIIPMTTNAKRIFHPCFGSRGSKGSIGSKNDIIIFSKSFCFWFYKNKLLVLSYSHSTTLLRLCQVYKSQKKAIRRQRKNIQEL